MISHLPGNVARSECVNESEKVYEMAVILLLTDTNQYIGDLGISLWVLSGGLTDSLVCLWISIS